MKKYLIISFSILIVIATVMVFSASHTTSTRDLNFAGLTPAKLKGFCKNDTVCYKTQLTLFMNRMGVEKTVVLLEATANITNGLYSDCHNISHDIGSEAFKLVGVKALQMHVNSCQWGFGHGVMVEASKELPAEQFIAAFGDYCNNDPSPIGCVHGIGHALAQKNASTNIMKATCNRVSTLYDSARAGKRDLSSKTANGACVEGWVMQKLGMPFYTTITNPNDALLICKSLVGEDLNVCNAMSVRNYVDIAVSNTERLARVQSFIKYCHTIAEKSALYECGRYLAEAADDVLVPSITVDTKYVGTHLNSICTPDISDACITSFTNYQINRNSNDYTSMLGVAKYLTPNLKQICLTSISHRYNLTLSSLEKQLNSL